MALFYHYTSLRNMTFILKSGWIEKGRLSSKDGIVENAVVNLTTDIDPAGHGLPDGRLVPDEAASRMAVTGPPGAYHCIDHTKFRLAVDIAEDDPLLVSAHQHHASEDGILFTLEINGWHPTLESTDLQVLQQTQKMFDQGIWKCKSPTWHYYFDRIAIERLLFIEIYDQGQWISGSVEEVKAQIS